MRVQPIPLVGGSYADETRPWSQQDTVNYLPSFAEEAGTRSQGMLKTPPGLRPYLEIPATGGIPSPPVRGTHNCEGKLFAVIGPKLYQISNTGVAIPIGTVPGIGRVRFTHNQISLGNELVVVNGSAGYVYNTVTGVFGRITDSGFPGAAVVGFIDSFIVGIEPHGRYAFNSGAAAATDYNTLDRFTSEVSPDQLVSLAVSNNELFLLSAHTGEFFENTGASQQPFRSKRITIDKGCAGPYTVVEADNTVFWLGSDGYFYQLNGYQPMRISKRPLEQAIRGLQWTQAFGYLWEDSGHTVVYWTFPDGRTWGFDTSNREWHRRESYGLNRWRVNSMTRWRNDWYAGDFQAGRIWKLDWNYHLEGDQEFESERTLAVIHDDMNQVLIPRLELLVDTGQAETVPAPFPTQPVGPTITGDAPDTYVGSTYSYAYTVTAGDAAVVKVEIVSGVLPDGLTMDNDGVITGSPTEAGTDSWTVRVTDANGLWDELSDSIRVTQQVFASWPVDVLHQSSLLSSGSGATWNIANYVTSGGAGNAEMCYGFRGALFSIRNGSGRVSFDIGATWQDVTGLPADRIPSSMVDTGNEVLLFSYTGADYANVLYATTDNINFTSRSFGIPYDDFLFDSVRRGDIVIVCAGVNYHSIRRSGDKGVTWTQQVLSGSGTPSSIADSGTTFAVFDSALNGNAFISTTGLAWTEKTMPSNSGIKGAAYDTKHSRIVCMGANGDCHYSADDGLNWQDGGTLPTVFSTTAHVYGNRLVYFNEILIAGCSNGIIYTSTDGGDTWVEAFNGAGGVIQSIAAWESA